MLRDKLEGKTEEEKQQILDDFIRVFVESQIPCPPEHHKIFTDILFDDDEPEAA